MDPFLLKVPCRNIFSQLLIPLGIAVLKDVPAVDAEYLICCGLDLLCRKQISVGQSTGKRDYCGIERDF
jgi:hypothetical protein